MSVRKRLGLHRKPWQVRYRDNQGRRRSKQFALKKDADAWATRTGAEVQAGLHVADGATTSVSEAGKLWVASAEAAGLERTTVLQYRQHLHLHINPFLGAIPLTKLSVASVRDFEERLRTGNRSAAMRRKLLVSLGSLLAHALECQLVARNVVRDRKRRRSSDRHERRGKLQVGIDIPLPTEIRAIVHAATGRWRPFFLTCIFSGLRASEMRGLRWSDVDLEAGLLHVRQRADRWGVIGPLKTPSSERSVSVSSLVINALREWRLACPKGPLDLVFPSGSGRPENHSNIVQRGLIPLLMAAGVTDLIQDNRNKPRVVSRYTGLHVFRHWYASWCLNRKEDGGLGLPYKSVQHRLGHATLAMTVDTYSHLFPERDEGEAMAAAERAPKCEVEVRSTS